MSWRTWLVVLAAPVGVLIAVAVGYARGWHRT